MKNFGVKRSFWNLKACFQKKGKNYIKILKDYREINRLKFFRNQKIKKACGRLRSSLSLQSITP